MPDEDKTFSGFFVLDLRIWWRLAHTLYKPKFLLKIRDGHVTDPWRFRNGCQVLTVTDVDRHEFYQGPYIIRK